MSDKPENAPASSTANTNKKTNQTGRRPRVESDKKEPAPEKSVADEPQAKNEVIAKKNDDTSNIPMYGGQVSRKP